MSKKLTREECENALINIYHGKKVSDSIDILYHLVKEYFDNPPLKFDDLKEGMWVWDDKIKKFMYTGNKYVLCEDGKFHFAPFYNNGFSGNLYDFAHTDGFDDDGNFIGYEIIIKEKFGNRFYRKPVD